MKNLKKETRKQKFEQAEARKVVLRIHEEASALQEKALKILDYTELTISDAIVFIEEGVKLELDALQMMCIEKYPTDLPPKEELTFLEKELERLKDIDISKLVTTEIFRFIIETLKIESASFGYPLKYMDI